MNFLYNLFIALSCIDLLIKLYERFKRLYKAYKIKKSSRLTGTQATTE